MRIKAKAEIIIQTSGPNLYYSKEEIVLQVEQALNNVGVIKLPFTDNPNDKVELNVGIRVHMGKFKVVVK